MITVVNLGISNLSSVLNALKYLGLDFCVSSRKDDISKSSHIVLPGVGTFGEGMSQLKENGLVEVLKEEVLTKKKPIIGICLGMQLLFETSEETEGVEGLGILKGNVIRLPKSDKYTIPRIGWAESFFTKDFLGFNKNDAADFYYIHSFYCDPVNKNITSIIDEEGKIACAVQDGNIFGCQFHPEKSHKAGLSLLKQFSQELL
jgi:glutamine amidotransferase